MSTVGSDSSRRTSVFILLYNRGDALGGGKRKKTERSRRFRRRVREKRGRGAENVVVNATEVSPRCSGTLAAASG